MPKRGYTTLTVENQYVERVRNYYQRLRIKTEYENLQKVKRSLEK